MDLFNQGRTLGVVYQDVHRFQALEGVFAVEHAGLIVGTVFGLQDAAAKAAVDGRAANQHGEFQPAPLEFVDDKRHLLGGADQQGGEADGGGVHFDGFRDDGFGGGLFAEVNDGVAVVDKNGLDQVFADVMHVTVNGGEDDGTFGDAFNLFEVGFEVGDGFFHHFGRLQNEGQDKFARAEFVADFFHGGQEDGVEDVDGGFVLGTRPHSRPLSRGERGVGPRPRPLSPGERGCALIPNPSPAGGREFPSPEGRGVRGEGAYHLIHIRFNPILIPPHDAEAQALGGGHAFEGVGFGSFFRFGAAFKIFDVTLERVGTAVENQVFGQFALFGGDFGVGFDVGGVDNRHIQPGADAVVEHDRVQGRTGVGGQAKGQVRDAQRGENARQGFLNQPDAFDGFDGRVGKFWVAGGESEGQVVEDERGGGQAMFVHGDIIDALGHFQFALAGFCHAAFVNGQDDDRGVVFFGEFENFVGFFAPGFKMGRVDETAPRRGLEGDFQHVQFGGVNHQRQVNAGRNQFADDLAHEIRLVAALGDGHGNIQPVRAVIHLVAGDCQDGVPIFSQQ